MTRGRSPRRAVAAALVLGSLLCAETASAGPTLYFNADDGARGQELWRSNGKARGTDRLKDLLPGRPGSAPTDLTSLAGTLYFVAQSRYADMDPERELWRSDGTKAGTRQVADTGCTSGEGLFAAHPHMPVLLGGLLFFTSCDGTLDGEWGRELWRSNGRAAGTRILKEINPNGSSFPTDPLVVDDALYFGAWDGTNGHELWRSDGTRSGTAMVEDIRPDNETFPATVPIASLGGIVLFLQDDGSNGTELWRSDGTPLGTYMVEDINPTDSAFPFSESTRVAKAHGVVYFGADDGVHGEELWRSDGTPIGTHMVKDINPAGSSLPGTTVTYGAESRVGSSRRPDSFVTVDGILYFSAVEHASGTELWRTDGTEDGTWRVKNINRTPKADDPTRDGSSWPGWLTRYKGTVLFAAQGRGTGVELWRSDGTGPGTYRVKDIRPDAPSYPGDLTRLGNRVFFRATTEAAGTELWRTDGTRSGTMLFAELRPGTRSSSPKFLEVVNH